MGLVGCRFSICAPPSHINQTVKQSNDLRLTIYNGAPRHNTSVTESRPDISVNLHMQDFS